MSERYKPNTERAFFTPSTILLPSDVRYALRYREARMSPVELRALADNGLERESLYLLLKSVAKEPERQRELLQSALGALHADTNFEKEAGPLREFLHTAISELPKDTQVVGDKLAQISRQGFDTWHDAYAETAKERAGDLEHETFIVGHSTLVGLDSFGGSFRGAGREFFILIPDHIEDTEVDSCGFVVSPDGQVQFLSKEFQRPHAVVVDDVIRTGTAMNGIVSFWTRNGAEEPTVDVIVRAEHTV